MTLVPHYPSDEPDVPDRAPDLDDLVERIIHGNGDGTPGPTPG